MYTCCIYKIERNMSEIEIEIASNNMMKTKNRMITKINRRHESQSFGSRSKAFESESEFLCKSI
jgi:hypothetical protein